jgi:uncharacterized protein YfkK (UPF0435 family)
MSTLSIIQSQTSARREILNKNGKVIRHEVVFGKQGVSASEIKANLRKANPNLKGKALTSAVANVLSGEKTMRDAITIAMVNKALQDGVTDKISETSNKLNISINKPKITKDKVISKQAERLAQLERIVSNLSPEELKKYGLSK